MSAAGDRFAFRLLLLCVVAYLIHVTYAVVAHRHLYGDGSWFLVRILSEGKVTNWYSDFAKEFYYSRIVSFTATQFLAVLVARLGSGDWQAASWALGATLFGLKLISLGICYRLLPKDEKIVFVFPALGLFAGTINSDIYIVTETHVATSFLWPLLIAIGQRRRPTTAFFALCGVALLLAAFSYESMAIFGPILLLVTLQRWRAAAESSERLSWAWLALCACALIAINWAAILFPRDPINQSQFNRGLVLLWEHALNGGQTLHIGPAVSFVAIAAVGVLLLVRVRGGRSVGRVGVVVTSAFLLAAPVAHFLTYLGTVDFSHAITDRVVGGLVVQFGLVLMYLVARHAGFSSLKANAGYAVMIVGALAVGQASWQTLATYSWRTATEGAAQALRRGQGVVECSAAALGVANPAVPAASLLCHWWITPLSVLLAPEGQVQALLVSAESFKPFDHRDPAALPRMTFAPVDYRRYLASTGNTRWVGVGETLSFTQGRRGLSFLESGFSYPEAWATWSEGTNARIRLCVRETSTDGPLQLRFTLAPFVNDRRPQLNAEVAIAGQAPQQWHFEKGQRFVERTVLLERRGGRDSCTRIAITFDDARPLSEIGEPGEPRRLGVAFISMRIARING